MTDDPPIRLIRYWFEFEPLDSGAPRSAPWVGVTAWTLDDARNVIQQCVYEVEDLPPVSRLIEDVDIRDLDEKHVRSHMDAPNVRGVWYPRGYGLTLR